LDFRIWFHWWASLGSRGMALTSLLPNGGLSILWLLRKARLSKRKETHPKREHPLLHSKVKLSKFIVTQVMARIWHNSRPQKVGTLIWLTLN
jgi:hypothetical protein